MLGSSAAPPSAAAAAVAYLPLGMRPGAGWAEDSGSDCDSEAAASGNTSPGTLASARLQTRGSETGTLSLARLVLPGVIVVALLGAAVAIGRAAVAAAGSAGAAANNIRGAALEGGGAAEGAGLVKEFQIMDVYQTLMGSDPFRFHCPLPLFARKALQGMTPSEAMEACCHDYNQMPMQWPYQFPECGPANCSTCWRESSSEASLSIRATAVKGMAALGYAASLAVGGTRQFGPRNVDARRLVDDAEGEDATRHAGLPFRQMLAEVHYGMRAHDANLCPRINDWEEYYLNDDLENTHARVYKSSSAKLAVIAFRGTQLDSAKNWAIDANVNLERFSLRPAQDEAAPLGTPARAPLQGPIEAAVHSGFLSAARRVLPHVRKWVEGYIEGTQGVYNVPADWQLLFTGHSLGGAFATLAATTAEVEGWSKRPDAVVAFGAPRLADRNLTAWWEANGLCEKLLRVNVYNDVVHWLPFWGAPQLLMGGLMGCATNIAECLQQPGSLFGAAGADPASALGIPEGDRWAHVCPGSELLIPGALKGVNREYQDFSPLGGILAHFLGNGLFGYGYGVVNGDVLLYDDYCGLRPDVFPRFECSTVESVAGLWCEGLSHDSGAQDAEACRQRCCEDPFCEVWQIMKDGTCWRGRSHVCHLPNEPSVAATIASIGMALVGERVH